MKKLILMLFILIGLNSCNYVIVDSNEIEEMRVLEAEEAYFEGQKDYSNGDKRIQLNNDSIYVWIKSPWNSGKNPKFIPQKLNTY